VARGSSNFPDVYYKHEGASTATGIAPESNRIPFSSSAVAEKPISAANVY
jgi:hypothetical protein